MGKVVRKLWMLTGMVMLLFIAGVYYIHAEGEGLLVHWPFDEGSGSVARDVSGNKMDGEITGAKWVEGKIGKALSFKGNPEAPDFVEILFGDNLELAKNSFTVTMWIKTSNEQYGQVLIEQYQDMTHCFLVRVQQKDVLTYIVQGAVPPPTPDNTYAEARIYLGGGHSPDPNAQIKISDGNWHHIVFGYDETQKVIFGYVDGQAHKTVPVKAFPVIQWSISIGKGKQGCFNGIIDDVRIYSRVLNAEEVTGLFAGK
ncbi:MAG: LamG domain-containing protein [Planctomycetes bacterium]|nr:LamG domain-containing protein [Planctomycetota bacterium]